MMYRSLPLFFLPLATVAAAQDLSFSAVRVVEHGKETPRVLFQLGQSGRLDATATCGSKSWRVGADVRAGETVLPLTGLAAGVYACRVDVSFRAADGSEGEGGFDLEVASLAPNQLGWSPKDLDLGAGLLTLSSERELSDARITVVGPRGAELDVRSADLSDPTRPTFRFDAHGQPVVKLLVESVDRYGFPSTAELLPWTYQIPHEDVVFPSDVDAIPADQLPKLEAVWKEVTEAIDLYGSVIQIQLWIGGYTDTVGDSAYNRALSERRARAIAAWFRQRGFDRPIWYQGFGEEGQAVSTGDAVDEARNRRSVYVLKADVPPTSGDFPRAAWKRL